MTGGPWSGALCALGIAAVLLLLAGIALMLRAQRQRSERFRETQEALRASEDRLRWALDATSEIVWDWDLAQDAIYHPSWAQTYGFPEERTPQTGKELAQFIHPEDMPSFMAEVSKVEAGPQDTFEVEHRALTASGDWKWMVGRARVVSRNAAGRATRMVGTCTDVTEHKRMLTRLQIADRLASIGTLAAGVAHEVNNPLASVIGNIGFSLQRMEALQETSTAGAGGPGSVRETVSECLGALRDAESGALRMRDIVRDVMLFSRTEEDVRKPVHVGHALRAALSLADNEIRHRARVTLDIDDVPPVLANESRLSQVFLNLLVNAAQAIPEGHADRNEIAVAVRHREASVVVEVRDTGCGIPPEHRQRLFDPFFTTKPLGIGTGLGLAICHGIVTALGGEIDVESAVGKGSTFRVVLPATAEAVPPEIPSPGPRRACRRGRILVVDDEPLFCRMAARTIGIEHEVVTLTDSSEALRLLRAGERFDVVVADLAMPVLTGMELHAEVARVDPGQAERMLFVTGGVFTPLAAEFVARHPSRVLEKPLPAQALRTAIAELLERAPRPLDAPAA
jgi:PAS domain S-box-containing protein